MLDRAVDILEYLEKATKETSLVELAGSLGLDKTTTYRLLSSLCDRQLVFKDPETRRYRLGAKLLELGSATARQWDVRRVAAPFLQRLRDACQETVGLYVRLGNSRVCIEKFEGLYEVRRALTVGRVQPLYPGAPGKVFLAYMPREEARSILASIHPIRFERGDWSDLGQAIGELDLVVAQGYAVAVEELFPNAATIACPIFDHTGHVAAVASLATITSRWSAQREAELAKMLRETAREISAACGYYSGDDKPVASLM
ncbi:MAG: IclR family transcriptional regulator [Chloroflexi bacterium]|nr:IclR family transcriptional regulator [Chloroflexota bacterium]